MTPTDDDIRAMLARRAGRARTGGAETETALAAARSLAAAEPRAARRRFGPAGWTPRLAGGLASLAAVAVACVVLAVPLLSRPPASGEPSAPSASGSATQPTTSPAPSRTPDIEAIDAAELQALVDARGAELVGRTFAVEGTLESDPSCAGRTSCADAIVAGTSIPVLPVGDIGPGPWDGSGPKSGMFALRISDDRGDGGRTIVEYLGDVLPAADGLAWSVDDLLAGEAREGGGFVAVRGWLVRTPLHPCPSIPAAPGNGIVAKWPRYGCPSDDYLTDERYQPLRADGSSLGPRMDSYLYMPSGAYDEWAPHPTAFGLGVEPREATYLLAWRAVAPCGPLADCYVGPEHFHWLMQGRLDPIPVQPR